MRTHHTRPALLLALAAAAGLAGCSRGDGLARQLNPFARSVETRPASDAAPPGFAPGRAADARGLVDDVTALSVEPMPGGAVVEARGLPPVQGFWDAELVALHAGRPVDGVLSYEFRIAPPPGPRRAGPAPSREVVAGAFVSDAVLAQTATVEVRGVRSARAARR